MDKYNTINKIVDMLVEQSVSPIGVETKKVPTCPSGYRW